MGGQHDVGAGQRLMIAIDWVRAAAMGILATALLASTWRVFNRAAVAQAYAEPD